MPDKVRTQGMPDENATPEPRKGNGAVDGIIPADKRGAGDGGPIGPKDHGEFHGGQSGAAYHGHGQLGQDEVEGEDNDNGVSQDP